MQSLQEKKIAVNNRKIKIMEMQHEHQSNKMPSGNMMYRKLALMIVFSFIAMYILMYAMVDRLANVIPNVNQFYMAGLMTMPMLMLELLVMNSMYKSKKINTVILAIAVIASFSFYFGIRQQAAVGDRQFLKSMIPHHAAAILMVEQAAITDPEIKKLADGIITTQRQEIAQMKAKLKALKK